MVTISMVPPMSEVVAAILPPTPSTRRDKNAGIGFFAAIREAATEGRETGPITAESDFSGRFANNRTYFYNVFSTLVPKSGHAT